MKLSLITSVLSAVLIGGCASHSTTKPVVNPTPSAVVTPAPVVSVPEPVPPLPAPTPEADPSAPEMTADGRLKMKGDVWELDLASPEEWAAAEGPFEFGLVNEGKKVIVILQREDWVDTTESFVKEVNKKFAEDKVKPIKGSMESVEINGRNAIRAEYTMKKAHIIHWSFTTGAEGFSLGCGSPEAQWASNKAICIDIADHFFLGAHPNTK